MNKKRKPFWRVPIGEAVLWPLPALLAAFSHVYAMPKASMSGTGPGFRIALMNEETVAAQCAWHFVDSLPWPFLIYAALLVMVYALCRLRHIRIPYRIIIFVGMALPGLWYFKMQSYLAGKIMTI